MLSNCQLLKIAANCAINLKNELVALFSKSCRSCWRLRFAVNISLIYVIYNSTYFAIPCDSIFCNLSKRALYMPSASHICHAMCATYISEMDCYTLVSKFMAYGQISIENISTKITCEPYCYCQFCGLFFIYLLKCWQGM